MSSLGLGSQYTVIGACWLPYHYSMSRRGQVTFSVTTARSRLRPSMGQGLVSSLGVITPCHDMPCHCHWLGWPHATHTPCQYNTILVGCHYTWLSLPLANNTCYTHTHITYHVIVISSSHVNNNNNNIGGQ